MTKLGVQRENFPVDMQSQGSQRRARFSAWELVEGVDWDDANLIPVVDYQRISHDQKKDAHGVKDQARDNLATAKRLGWTIVARFTDNDITASKADVERPAFKLLIKCLKKGQLPNGQPFRGVIVQDEDRLVKRNDEYEKFVEALTYEDGRVYADMRGTKDLYSEDVEGLGHIAVVFRVMETRKKQRRLRTNHHNRAMRGETVGRRTFGWSVEDHDKLDPIEAEAGRLAVREFISGRSIDSLVKQMNQAGFVTTTGRSWCLITLRNWLTNPRLCGYRRMHGQELLRDETGAPIVGKWEPLVSVQEWEAVQARIDARRGKRVGIDGKAGADLGPDHGARRYVWSGYLRCGAPGPDGTICHCRLRASNANWLKGYRYFCQCVTQGGCGKISRNGRYVDQFLGQAILARIERLHGIQETAEAWTGGEALARKIQQRKEITEAWNAGDISSELYWPEITRMERKIKELRAEEKRHALKVERAVTDISRVRRRWELPEEEGGYDLGQRRAIIDQYVYAVTVHPTSKRGPGFDSDALEIHWRD